MDEETFQYKIRIFTVEEYNVIAHTGNDAIQLVLEDEPPVANVDTINISAERLGEIK